MTSIAGWRIWNDHGEEKLQIGLIMKFIFVRFEWQIILKKGM